MALDGSLSRWSHESENPSVVVLLTQLEKMYQYWMIYRYPKHYRSYMFGSLTPEVPVTSLINEISANGDNSFQLRVAVNNDGTELTADCAEGRELVGWLLARDFVSKQSIQSHSDASKR